MAIDFSIDFSSQEPPEVEVIIDAGLVTDLAREIEAIDKRFGPDRSIGPVRIMIRGDETLVHIGTQKQGDQEYLLDEYGFLKEER